MSRLVSLCLAASALVACGDEPNGSLAPVGASEEAITIQDTWHGDGAVASGGDGAAWFEINVHEDRQAGEASRTWINFSRNWVDPTSYHCVTHTGPCKCPKGQPCTPDYQCTWEWCGHTRYGWEYGYGAVAPGAFHAAKSRARLSASLTSEAGFWIDRCDVDEEAELYECTSGAEGGGVVDLEWKANRLESWRQTAASEYRAGGFVNTSQGHSRGVSADVFGSAFGLSPQGGGITSATNVSKSRQPAL